MPDCGAPKPKVHLHELHTTRWPSRDENTAPGADRIALHAFGKIFREIVTALAELLAEDPEAGEILRGRTFARVLH